MLVDAFGGIVVFISMSIWRSSILQWQRSDFSKSLKSEHFGSSSLSRASLLTRDVKRGIAVLLRLVSRSKHIGTHSSD